MKQNKIIFAGLIVLLAATGCRSHQEWASVFIKKGKTYMEKKDFSKAVLEFQKATHIDPKNVEAYLNSADAYIALDNCEVALEYINQASIFNPKIDAEFYFKKGQCLMLRQTEIDIKSAILDGYDLAIREDATQARYFYQRGLAARALGEEEAALADLAKARQLEGLIKG